jgi:hypothetical protein
MYAHLNDTTPVARKDHRCLLCGLQIAKGEKHLARRAVFEGEIGTDRMHLECHQVTLDNGWTNDDWENQDEQYFRMELQEWREAKENGNG